MLNYKANKTSFQKGKVSNPKGRPKGAVSPLKKQLLELRKRAAEDMPAAYKILWDDFTNGDASEKQLAKQIYFKELMSMPTKWLDQTVFIPKEDGINRLGAVTNALLQFAELTHDEVLNEISTFKNIEEKEQDNKEEIKGSVDEMTKLVLESWSKNRR